MQTLNAGTDVINLLKLCYAADRPVLFEGPHGIGKSELVAQAAAEMKIDYISRDLSLLEPVDLTGLPKIRRGQTVYMPPAFLPTSGRGLIVFEELNRAHPSTVAPCLQLLTARSLGDYQLPAGWLPVACANPADEDYHVQELDRALVSRFVAVKLKANVDEWLCWARDHGVHADVLQYVASDKRIFDDPNSNPRAWKYVSDLLSTPETMGVPRQILRAAIAGLVGTKRATDFLRQAQRVDVPLKPDDVLKRYAQHRSRVCQWIQEGKTDLLHASMIALLKYLQPPGAFDAVRTSRGQWDRLKTFLGDLPLNLQQEAREFLEGRGFQFPNAIARRAS